MEITIIVVIIALTIFAVAYKQASDRDETRDQLIISNASKYPNVIGDSDKVFMYNNETESVCASKVDTKNTIYENEFTPIYVTKFFMAVSSSVYIGSEKLPGSTLNLANTTFIKDDKYQKIHFLTFHDSECIHKELNYNDIINVSIIIDGNAVFSKSTMRTIGGAAAGSVLLGGAGAVVGGLSGDTKQVNKVKRISIKFLIRNNSDSSFEFVIFDGGVKSTDVGYKSIMKYADSIKDCISVILDKLEQEEELAKINTSQPASISVADELAKLANLKEQGIITQEEFDVQKKKMLSE